MVHAVAPEAMETGARVNRVGRVDRVHEVEGRGWVQGCGPGL